MDHITKPASRKTLRRLASYFREMCGIKQEGVFMQFLTKPVVKWMDDKKITPIREIFHTDREQAVELIKKLRKAQYVGFFGKYLHGYVQQVEE